MRSARTVINVAKHKYQEARLNVWGGGRQWKTGGWLEEE